LNVLAYVVTITYLLYFNLVTIPLVTTAASHTRASSLLVVRFAGFTHVLASAVEHLVSLLGGEVLASLVGLGTRALAVSTPRIEMNRVKGDVTSSLLMVRFAGFTHVLASAVEHLVSLLGSEILASLVSL
jgi:hypothetical protein